MEEQGHEDRTLPARSGMLVMKTFPGGTVIGNDNVQGMTKDWKKTMENF